MVGRDMSKDEAEVLEAVRNYGRAMQRLGDCNTLQDYEEATYRHELLINLIAQHFARSWWGTILHPFSHLFARR